MWACEGAVPLAGPALMGKPARPTAQVRRDSGHRSCQAVLHDPHPFSSIPSIVGKLRLGAPPNPLETRWGAQAVGPEHCVYPGRTWARGSARDAKPELQPAGGPGPTQAIRLSAIPLPWTPLPIAINSSASQGLSHSKRKKAWPARGTAISLVPAKTGRADGCGHDTLLGHLAL